MQHGMLFTLLLSLSLWVVPVSAVEMVPTARQQLLHDHQLQQKVAELVEMAVKDDTDALSFALQRLALPQQEAVRYLLLQHLEQSRLILSPRMVNFVDAQRHVAPVYQVLEKGEGYEFSVPAFDYPGIANRLIKRWNQDQSVLDFVLKAERYELNLRQWLSGNEHQVQAREALLMREFNSLSPEAVKALTDQLTQAAVTSWLPSSAVMVRMAQVSEDPQVYKLLWLMRADFHVEQELDRLAKQGDTFALQQIMAAVDNPRLKTKALKELTRTKPMTDEVKTFLVDRLGNSDEAPIVAQALADQGYQSWLKEILLNNRQVKSHAILQVLTQ
ncbi:hypothetical protein K6U56_13585 [Vibrio furnissii]|uniref:hypothetical protein n=1 Tax=Vibrio TaxID=662 RepID=UPI001302134E|nr:hypothetical protein [Vibrio furnissii]MCG6212987.1 hypothetical protein [Vibrio furnissii]WHR50839.1 hypothetical protein O8413_12455 [Vibrio furnissii]